MNENMNQQPKKKGDGLKIALIIILSIGGVLLVGVIGFFVLMLTIFNIASTEYKEAKEEIYEKWEDSNSSSGDTENDEEDEDIIEAKPTQPTYEFINNISYQTFNEMIDNGETFVILISQRDCGHCVAFKPYYNQAMKENNIIGYELDVQLLNQTDRSDFLSKFNISSTPTTMIFTNGVPEEETLVGTQPPEEVTNFSKKYNLI
jgi:thiol-disulfide isomerase/thioredoxin